MYSHSLSFPVSFAALSPAITLGERLFSYHFNNAER
jgi:hypothetical protein